MADKKHIETIKALQLKIGVNPDGSIGKNTIRATAAYFHLSDIHAAHFFAQCHHESQGFTKFEENLNYSGAGLVTTFNKYFPSLASTVGYERIPKKIANKVYADRMGNGDSLSGDGWKFRGRGAIQLTGKDNYQEFADSISSPGVMNVPDLVSTIYAFDSAIFFFNKNNVWDLCKDTSDSSIVAVTKRINGGVNGLNERRGLTHLYSEMLKK
jgi:putative chitinase